MATSLRSSQCFIRQMSKETRTVRPYVGLGDLSAVLDQAILRFGQDVCLAQHTITVDAPPDLFLIRTVAIEWATDSDSFAEFKRRITNAVQKAGFERGDLSIVI